MTQAHEWHRGEYTISTDRSRLALGLVHRFLSEEAYWSPGVARDVVERSIRNSLCFGLYDRDRQILFFVDFASGWDDSFTAVEFDELVNEYDLISCAAHPTALPIGMTRTGAA